MEGCYIRTPGFIAAAALITLLAACSPSGIVPGHIEVLAGDGEIIERLHGFEGQGITAVYIIRNGEGIAKGIIQEAEARGFKDMIRVLTLVDTGTGLIERVDVLEHHETEDYGGYVTEKWFLNRFSGKSAEMKLLLVKIASQGQEDVTAITGATRTSQAVVDAVNLCLENYRKIKREVK